MRPGDQLLNKIGKVPLCNECAERAPHIKGFCFPLCWRCTSLCIGVITGTIVFDALMLEGHFWLFRLLLCIPCILDGTLQEMTSYRSTNRRRIWTGLLAGVGLSALVEKINMIIDTF